jgi:type VI secretion system VasD/TssJ family lipoprotein
MTRANEVSSRAVSLRWARTGVAAAVGVLLVSMVLSGCGWIFKKEHKPLLVEVELTATDSLNFDGERAQAVQLKLYILKDDARFMSGDTRAFFDDKWNMEWREQVFHKQDTLATTTVTIIPGEVKMAKLEVPYAYARDAKPVFAAIADFLHPPSSKSERLAFKMQKKSSQKIKLAVGKDWIVRPGKN